MALDVASDGNFNTRYPADATTLTEPCLQQQYQECWLQEEEEVHAKLDLVHNLLTEEKHVHFAAEDETIKPEPESEEGVFYIDGQGYKKFGQPQGNFSGKRFIGNKSSSGYTQNLPS